MPTDGKVRITPENLRETAEWRAIIQKAVNEGRYAVNLYHVSLYTYMVHIYFIILHKTKF